jgi:hypothetical protein
MNKQKIKKLAKLVLCIPLLMGFGCASFELTSIPRADIYEDGDKVGRTPYTFSMMSGERTLYLRKAGYIEEKVVISSTDQQEQFFRLRWIGRTRIDSLPRGAKVLNALTEETMGITPFSLRMAKPEHVRIVLQGFEPAEVEILPNETRLVELKPLGGFKSSFYRDIQFVSPLGRVEIYDRVAGERIGTTPVSLNIEAGSELEYRKEGYAPRQVMISRSSPRRINIDLEPISRVTLRGPTGAEVFRAGGVKKIGTVPYTVDVANDMIFEIRKEGYYKTTVAVAPGTPSELDVGLKEIPYKTITSVPAGAEVFRLGGHEKLGVTPFTAVVDSERVFEIKKRGFRTSVVGVGPGSPDQLDIPLNASGRDDPDAAAISTLDSPVITTY